MLPSKPPMLEVPVTLADASLPLIVGAFFIRKPADELDGPPPMH